MTSISAHSNPFDWYKSWLKEAISNPGISIPEASCLCTVTDKLMPQGRIILIKEITEEGFVFYTNIHSQKGVSLAKHPQASLTTYWEPLGYQVRIEGVVSSVSDELADRYFASRPKDSQLGAWASQQSDVIPFEDALQKNMKTVAERYKGKTIPRPPHWVGYCLIPNKIEFWIDKPFRLHDRFVFVKNGEDWNKTQLFP